MRILKTLATSLMSQGVFVFLLILCLRLVEFLTIPKAFPSLGGYGFAFFYTLVQTSALFAGIYLCSAGLVLALIRLRFKKLYQILFTIFSFIILLLFLSGTHFYQATGILLDKVIFYFRISELLEIAGSETGQVSGELLWFYVFSVLVLMLFLGIHFIRSRGKTAGSYRYNAIPFGLLVLTIVSAFVLPEGELPKPLKKTAVSKTYYFANSLVESLLSRKHSGKSFEAAVKDYREFAGIPQLPIQNEYPLIHVFDEEKGDISAYFKPFDTTPNIVMVYCEGLSSSFTGEGAYYGNHTPHLDSLFKKGLYWPHAVSNADRTHGIFANSLASMPHGFERGALNYRGEKYPEHFSVSKHLRVNGYDAAFIYGGWAQFDNYEPFLQMNYVEKIYGESFFKTNYQASDFKEGTHNSWGIPDIDFFDLFFGLKPEHQLKPPYFSVFLTQSLHSPFKVPDQEKYLAKAKKQFYKVNDDTELFETHHDQFSTIAYMDEAIGRFMAQYKTRPEYENTVFIFTGDHNCYGLPLKNDLDEHDVPLLIYSPKLKQPMKFQDIVAHTDLPASIVKLLSPYLDKGEVPRMSNWMSPGLSTTNELKATKPIFVGDFKGVIKGVIKADTLYIHDDLYKIMPQMLLKELTDIDKTPYKNALENYRMINQFVFENDKLLFTTDTTYLNRKFEYRLFE